MYQDFTDIELVELYKKDQDPECVGVLFKRYSRMSYAVCMKLLKNPSDSREAVMLVFESLFDYLKKYEIENFRSWLLSVLRNQCLRMIKENAKSVDFNEYYEKNSSEFVESGSDFTLSIKERQEQLLQQLGKALRVLPLEQSKCVELFYMKGMSYDQVSEATGYSFNQVKSYIQNGRRNLKNILTKPGSSMAVLLVFLFYLSTFN